MYIIHTAEAGTNYFHIGEISTSPDGKVTVTITGRPIGELLDPEGMVLNSWTNKLQVPPETLTGATTTQSVAEWLISDEGYYKGGTIAEDEDVRFLATRADLSFKVKRLRDKAEASGAVTPHGIFDSDPDSQRKVNGAVVMAMLDSENFSMEWRLKDNSIVTLDHDQMCQVGVAMGQHVAACQIRKNQLDAAIAAAETVANLEAIDIKSGWPG